MSIPGSIRKNKLVQFIIWFLISATGALAVAVSALHRGEQLNSLWLVVAGVCSFAVAYRFYSAWLMAKVLTLDDRRAPPAITKSDGRDYVPTNKWVVFGHHFAAIAGPGPLVGPVLAAQFGYLPGTLWILIGATLGGGVHDAVILFASMRRNGKSLGQMLKEEINPFLGLISMVCLLGIMTILLAVLGLVVVKSLAHSPWGLFTIAMTIPLSMIMGLAMKTGKFSVLSVSIFGVIGLLACVWGGSVLPDFARKALTWNQEHLAFAIMIYGFAAAVLPVWLLLAPRDYLSTFMKLGTVVVLGIFVVIVAPPLKMPALTPFIHGGGWVVPGPVFPFVCITIACGAVSGFHSLISSGTTPKLLERERHIRLIGYGSMVTEMLVALMAIIAACALEPGQYFAINRGIDATDSVAVEKGLSEITAAGYPVTSAEMLALTKSLGEETTVNGQENVPSMIGKTGGAPTFAVGMAIMFSKVIPGETALSLWYHFAIMFEALFILTTLDAGTRVGRFILQDLLGQFIPRLQDTKSLLGNVIATGLLVAAWGYFLYQGAIDPGGISNSLWPIFGISNQLLAVIAFALGTTVLIKMGRVKYVWVTAVPLVFLTIVTFSAGTMKLVDPNSKGFIPELAIQEKKIAAATLATAEATPELLKAAQKKLTVAKQGLTNLYVDIGITLFFLVGVALILVICIREWILLLTGRRENKLREADYVALPDGSS